MNERFVTWDAGCVDKVLLQTLRDNDEKDRIPVKNSCDVPQYIRSDCSETLDLLRDLSP